MNIEELKRTIDITELEPLNGMKPAYKNSNSVKYGYCPHCGNGKDRLHIYEGKDGNQIYHCTKCGHSGNAVQFYAATNHLTISEAVKELNRLFLSPATPQPINKTIGKTDITASEKKTGTETAWKQNANNILKQAQEYIFTDNQDAKQARQYLNNRGITDETIRATGIGYRPKSIADKSNCKQYGILIPTYSANGTIERIKIRFIHEVNGSRYGLLTGSKANALYNADTISNLIQARKAFSLFICEGELDAILLQDIFTGMSLPMIVGTFGSVDHIPSVNTEYKKLLAYPTDLFIGMDNDDAGKNAARKIWTLRQDSYTLYPIGYKDWSEWYASDKQAMINYLGSYFQSFSASEKKTGSAGA